MDYEVEELQGLRRKLKIKIPEDIVSERIKKAYKEVNRQIRIPGFRPGKIPMNILEKQVPVQSFTKMFQELMQEYYEKALKMSGIEPAGEPEIDHTELKDFKKDAPLKFSVLFDVKASMDLKEYRGMKFRRKNYVVSEEEVDQAIEKITSPFGTLEDYPEGHEAQTNDFVLMDFKGSLHGGPLENGDAYDYTVRLGEGQMIPGFEDQIVGHKAGEEFDIRVPLPVDWNKKLRRVSLPIPGKENDEEVDVADFKVRLKGIKKLVLPELTPEFLQRKEIGMNSLDEFRRAVRADLQGYKEHQEEAGIKEAIFNKLVEDNDVDPPESAINREVKFMIEGMKFQIEKSGSKLEDSGFDEDTAKVEWREKATFNAKGYYLLEEIANREKIQIVQSDLDNEFERLSKETGQNIDQVRKSISNNRESLAFTTSKLRGQKALNLVFSHCEFEYIEDKPADDPQKAGEDDSAKEQ